ncbi:MAG: hypothetical protein NTU83_09550 [Candidatus Hydrogenedentes bacterium]|nr:hypothetical protein [Candidatus Hydrogenedentota bacterium]
MRKMLALSALCILLLAACSAPAPPPTPVNLPPPEDTPEQIATKIRPALQPLETIVAQGKGAAGRGMTNEIRNKLIADLKVAKQQNQGSENGKQALKMITHDLETIIQKGRDQERFGMVLAAIAGYQELEPLGVTMQRLKDRAEQEVMRPFVTVKGFFDDKATGETYVFLDVKLVDANLQRSPVAQSVRVRKGEEFYNCRLVDFVGDKKGVTLEYLKIPGTMWNVMVP